MLLSRFWYVVLGLLLGASLFTLYLAQSMYNRTNSKGLGEGLSSDSQVVSWYMRSLSRERSAQLIKFALNPDVSQALQKSSRSEKMPKDAQQKASEALAKLVAKVPEEFAFDAVFAVDQHGRVVGRYGFEQAAAVSEFELGGYPAVADALHGYIRDDTFVWDRMYTVVTRPVEYAAGDAPVGAIVGLRLIDDRFAREVSARTGAAIAFYIDGERVASGSPEEFDRSQLDGILNDLKLIEQDTDYTEKGRSTVRQLSNTVAVVYTRMSGEAWHRGAGYVVGRMASVVASPLSFFAMADDKDKANVNLIIVIALALLAILIGVVFTYLEHTRPLRTFVTAVEELGAGKTTELQASRVTGVYRKIVTLINDAIDLAVAKGGGSRRAADLQHVLGDVPDQPAMSAFAFGGSSDPGEAPTSDGNSGLKPLPFPPPSSATAPQTTAKSVPKAPPSPGGRPPAPPPRPAAPSGAGPEPLAQGMTPAAVNGEAGEWRRVFEDFLATKQQCGESIHSLTYEKFEVTLVKNKQAIMDRHGVSKVRFSVYVKDGKAALKASPIRE